MSIQLKKMYYRLLAPAVAGFLAVFVIKWFSPYAPMPESYLSVMAPTIFILVSVVAVAGPIFYRTLFTYYQREKTRVSAKAFYQFERNQTALALVAPYLALAGYVMELPRFHMTSVILMTLYAVYYFYPNEKRICVEEKIYRVGR